MVAPEVRLEELPSEAQADARPHQVGRTVSVRAGRAGVLRTAKELLPIQSGGYYREYTVRTPGVRDRGARRIVAGSGGEYYYSDDHYRSFRRIKY